MVSRTGEAFALFVVGHRLSWNTIMTDKVIVEAEMFGLMKTAGGSVA
jgi:hypothetical protein